MAQIVEFLPREERGPLSGTINTTAGEALASQGAKA